MKQLLEAGANFGLRRSGGLLLMRTSSFTKRNGIHIIDLEQTVSLLGKACDFVQQIVAEGGSILFVGTKKQAQAIIEEEAKRCNMYYVNQRWIGGVLTNFATIQARIDHLVRLEDQQARGDFNRLPKKEALKLGEEILRLNRQVGGFKEMTSLPAALFIVDITKENIALAEAKRVGIPVVAVIDTNCNPVDIDYPIPANDDAIKAIKLMCNKIADSVIESKISEVMIPTEEEQEEGVEELEATETTGPSIVTPTDE